MRESCLINSREMSKIVCTVFERECKLLLSRAIGKHKVESTLQTINWKTCFDVK